MLPEGGRLRARVLQDDSRTITRILRHAWQREGFAMDSGGWVSASKICARVRPTFTLQSLLDLALDGFKSGKQRLQLCVSRHGTDDPTEWFVAGVRACQGISTAHARGGRGDCGLFRALESRVYRRLLPAHTPYLDVLVHATMRGAVIPILMDGLKPGGDCVSTGKRQNRTHVHMSPYDHNGPRIEAQWLRVVRVT